MDTTEEKTVISEADLQSVGEWLKTVDLSAERLKILNESTQTIISEMGFIDPAYLSQPYTI